MRRLVLVDALVIVGIDYCTVTVHTNYTPPIIDVIDLPGCMLKIYFECT